MLLVGTLMRQTPRQPGRCQALIFPVLVASCLPLCFTYGCSTNQAKSMNPPPPTATTQSNLPDHASDELIRNLRIHPLTRGPSAGGPVWGILPDEVTGAIIAQGRPIVPRLIDELSHSNWAESVYIVYCLRELKAKNARPNVLELQRQLESGDRFANEQKNYTLDVLIRTYLRESFDW